MENEFIKKIQNYLCLVEDGFVDKNMINSMAEYIFSRQELLDNNDETIELINLISEWLHDEPISDVVFKSALYSFFIRLIAKEKVDVFYIGNLDLLKSFALKLEPLAIKNIYYLSSEEKNVDFIYEYFLTLDASIAPFVIYDPYGLKLSIQTKSERIVDKISLYDLLNYNLIPTSSVVNQFSHYLIKQYGALCNKNVKTVVLGNSYGFYGFPDDVLSQSVNISMHSFGIKQLSLLAEHIIVNYPHIENFVFCVGFFDLYFDLFKTKDEFNKDMIDTFSHLMSYYNIRNITNDMSNNVCTFSDIAIPVISGSISDLSGVDDIKTREDIYRSAQHMIGSEVFPARQEQMATSQQRAKLHSNSVKHVESLSDNQISVNKLVARLNDAGKNNVWLTPPFPVEYVKNIVPEMILTHRQFFSQFESELYRFIDLSENTDFQDEDFRDGDHLNYAGAKKMVEKLRKLNVSV